MLKDTRVVRDGAEGGSVEILTQNVLLSHHFTFSKSHLKKKNQVSLLENKGIMRINKA